MICRYLDVIVKQKRVSDAASQQLLLDAHIVKTILLQLPAFGMDGGVEENPPSGMCVFIHLLD